MLFLHDFHLCLCSEDCGRALCHVKLPGFIFEDVIESVGIFAPVFLGLVFSHDEEGCRESVCKRAILADDGCRDNAAVSRVTGAGINDVVVADAVFFKKALIAAGGYNTLVLNIQDPEVVQFALGILDGNAPGLSVL